MTTDTDKLEEIAREQGVPHPTVKILGEEEIRIETEVDERAYVAETENDSIRKGTEELDTEMLAQRIAEAIERDTCDHELEPLHEEVDLDVCSKCGAPENQIEV